MNKDLVKVVIIDEPFAYAEMEVLGLPLREYIIKELKEFNPTIVECSAMVGAVDTKYLLVLYSHMPLVTMDSVNSLIEHCEINAIKALNYGSGFIRQSDLSGEPNYSYSSKDTLSAADTKNLSEIYSMLSMRNIDKAMQEGAIILDKTAVYLDYNVKVLKGAIIHPMVTIKGDSLIHEGAIIRSGSVIENSIINAGANIWASFINDSIIGEKTTVGPCALIRSGSVIEDNVRIGDFVEIKASRVGGGSKAAHLTYIGDAEVGKGVNVGCGTVFCNYDGKLKHKTIIGDNAFIGSNTNLVAPIKIGNNAFTAAGSTVTEDVPDNMLCIARARQVIKERKI